MQNNNSEEKYQKIQRRVRKLHNFYQSLITYVVVNLVLLIINLFTTPRHLWFIWVAIIWGCVLIIQAINTFTIRDRFLSQEWEKKKIEELLEKEEKKNKR